MQLPVNLIKICGIRTVKDAKIAVELGANAIGLNLWPNSPRSVDLDSAIEIGGAIGEDILRVAVMVDPSPDALSQILRCGVMDLVQLHGDESPEMLRLEPGKTFKAVGVGRDTDLQGVLSWPGDILLVDARDPLRKGGTGVLAPEDVARTVCRARRTILAGGLNSGNIYSRITTLNPWGVDAASGVEFSPGRKCPEKTKTFIEEAKRAFAQMNAELEDV
ncbi:MAG: phosphoribosylanthranilate isomerase [Myxococcota bacterium]|nr:phosphoribosylanthranilate isomerase [Myxococcota bacterium]